MPPSDEPQEVTDPLSDYPQLRIGVMAMESTVPHAALAYKGERISIVYFSRKGSLEMRLSSWTSQCIVLHDVACW